MPLNPRHEQFAAEYLACAGNASEAYRRTYPRSRKWTDKAVWTRAYRLFSHAEVKQRVEELQRRASEAKTMTVTEACQLLTEMGRGKLDDYLDDHGRIDPLKVKDAGRAVMEFAETPGPNGTALRLKLDAKGAIALLGKYLGWEKPQQVQVSNSVDVEAARETVREAFRAMSPEERAAWLRQHQS